LIGHSLGAHIALRLAAIYPEWISRMVTIEAVGAPPEIERRRATQTADDRMRNWFAERRAASMAPIREFSSVQQAVERMKGRHPFLSPAQALHLTRHGLRQAGKAAWRWKHDPYVAVWAFPDIAADEVEALWSRIACPTLLLGGERSWPSAVPAQLLRTIPDAQQVKLAQSGHWPHHDALDACLAAILKFIPPTL
jgi:pimeloyl-ACP methyl ester carboxylesterase